MQDKAFNSPQSIQPAGCLLLLIFLAAGLFGPGESRAQEESVELRPPGGFAEPIQIIPEIGLWADAFTELGYGSRPGLVVWWGLSPETATDSTIATRINWAQVPFRIRAEIYNDAGYRVSREQKIVEPPRPGDEKKRGGFPTQTHLILHTPGTYRVRLEAYPLIDEEEAGLDSIPRQVVELEATVAGRSITGPQWQISDLVFLEGIHNWSAGSPAERTWYEWVVYPNVPRTFYPDTSGAYVAFEIERGEEQVPSCQFESCRVLISVSDGEDRVFHQVFREVPDAASVSAYVVPIETLDLETGRYRVEVHVFEGGNRMVGAYRTFAVMGGESDLSED